MTNKNGVVRFIALFCAVGVLTGCVETPPAPSATATPVATPTVAVATATATPEATATAIPLPTQPPKPTLTPDVRPAIDSPAWFNEATLYQIFPRSFYDSDDNGIGDLNGIREKLDYVQSLGADTIWLNPHYPSATYHGYDVVDYTDVNPDFGTLADFKALLVEMKKRNMKLIVDFVANHSSDTHPFFKDAFKNPASKYTSWYRFKDDKNETYESFFGISNLPEWNHENSDVNRYLIDSVLFWLGLGVDGIRCDYALGIVADVWKQLRDEVKAKHPDAVILGEVFDSRPSMLKQKFEQGFDALFDFPWYFTLAGGPEDVGKGALNGRAPAEFIADTYTYQQLFYPRGAQMVRFPSNHDTNRIASSVDGDARKMRLAAAVSILTPGIPIVYYGEEIGMRGIKGTGPIYDEFRREPMDWYASETGTGMTTWFKPNDRNNKPNDGISTQEEESNTGSLLKTYRALTAVRNQHPALRGGSSQFQVMGKDEITGCEACLGVWRWSDTGDEVIALFFNFGDAEHTIGFNAPKSSPMPLPGNSSFIYGQSSSTAGLVIEPWGTIALRWAGK